MALTTIWFAVGALLMAFIAFTGIPFQYQLLIFLVISSAMLFFCRKASLKWFTTKRERTNVDAVIGQSAIVIKKITKFDKGEIKIGGIIWSARTIDGTEISEDTECSVQKIEGVTAIVIKK